jgi:hypothetical protein
MNGAENSVLHFLREVIPFRFLPREVIRGLAGSLEIREFARGTLLRSAGSDEAAVLMILDGTVRMGSERPVPDSGAVLGPGQFFGEWEALFSLAPELSVSGESGGSMAVLADGEFRRLIAANSSFAQALAAIFRDRRGIFQAFDRFRAELMRGVAFGHFEISDLMELYRRLEPALHPLSTETELIDYGALQYAVRRLPQNISRTFALLLRDELPEVFDDPGEYIPEIPTQARRRSVWEMLPGKDLVLLRSGLSDLTDLITCLCLYAVEVRKIRQRLYFHRSFPLLKTWLSDPAHFAAPEREDPAAAREVLGNMKFTDSEIDSLMEIWPGRSVRGLYELGLHREMFSVDVRRHRSRHESHRAELWTVQIAAAVRRLIGSDPGDLDDDVGVHIISSNTHSVTNCINPWYRDHADEVLHWGGVTAHSAMEHEWNREMDLVYALTRDFLAEHPDHRRVLKEREAERGITSLPGTLATGIEVQIIDLSRAAGSGLDPRIGDVGYRGRDIIVNIDYAFGEQAEHILRSLILLFHRNIRSVNFLGKAGALTGSRGDVLIPDCFIQQIGDEVQERIDISPETVSRIAASLGVHRVHTGPMVTVEGTLLQNRIMLMYYQRLWKAVGIEMEGAYYHHQVSESMRTGLLSGDIDQRYLYYVSDLPLGTGHNLSIPMAAAEGVPPLYAITAEVLRGILGT